MAGRPSRLLIRSDGRWHLSRKLEWRRHYLAKKFGEILMLNGASAGNSSTICRFICETRGIGGEYRHTRAS